MKENYKDIIKLSILDYIDDDNEDKNVEDAKDAKDTEIPQKDGNLHPISLPVSTGSNENIKVKKTKIITVKKNKSKIISEIACN